MELTDKLNHLDEEHLMAIAQAWTIATPTLTATDTSARTAELAAFLVQKLQSKQDFITALKQLTKERLDIFFYIVAAGGIIGIDELTQACFKNDKKAAAAFLGFMETSGFLFQHETLADAVYIPTPYLNMIDLPVYFAVYLGRLLWNQPIERLEQIAATILPTPMLADHDRHILIYHIRSTLLDQNYITQYIEGLGTVKNAILNELKKHDGYALRRDLLDLQSRAGYETGKADALNDMLDNSGLIFFARKGRNPFSDLLIIPYDILALIGDNKSPHLPTFADNSNFIKGLAFFQHSSVDNIQTPHTLLRDMVALIAQIKKNNFRLNETGLLRVNDQTMMLSLFGPERTSTQYIDFLTSFIIEEKLMTERNQQLRISRALMKMLKRPQVIYTDIFNWWISTAYFNTGTTDIKLKNGFIQTVKKSLLEALKAIPLKTWIPAKAFTQPIVPMLKSKLIAFENEASKGFLTQAITTIITDDLRWLGVTLISENVSQTIPSINDMFMGDVGQTTLSTDYVFQITPLGKLMLENLSENSDSVSNNALDRHEFFIHEADWAIIQSNMEIITPPDLSLCDLWRLCMMSEISGLDVMSIFVVNQQSLHALLTTGTTAQAIVEFCERLSKKAPLPDTVRTLIKQMGEKCSKDNLRLLPASACLTVGNPAVFDQIVHNDSIKPFILTIKEKELIVFTPEINIEKIKAILSDMKLLINYDFETFSSDDNADTLFVELSKNELQNITASLSFIEWLDKYLGTTISDERLRDVLSHLTDHISFTNLVEEKSKLILQEYIGRARFALDQKVTEQTETFKTKLERLAQFSIDQRTDKAAKYQGQNPATTREDIEALCHYAIDNELELHIRYLKKNNEDSSINISPRALESGKVYAMNLDTEAEAVFALDRVAQARFLCNYA